MGRTFGVIAAIIAVIAVFAALTFGVVKVAEIAKGTEEQPAASSEATQPETQETPEETFSLSAPAETTAAESASEAAEETKMPGRYIDRIQVPDYGMDFYNALAEGADNDGIDDVLIDVYQADYEDGSYYLPIASFSGNYTSSEELKALYQSRYQEVMDCARDVMSAFIRDFPEVFWLSESFSYSSNYRGNSDHTYNMLFYLSLHQENGADIRRISRYPDADAIRDAIREREELVSAVLSGMPDEAQTDVEKVAYFNEWLTMHNEYNTRISEGLTKDPPDLSKECISALRGSIGENGPVCEGYSKAFQILCEREGIPCTLVSNDDHMWNYVQIDGNWYGMDVTWNDPSGGDSGAVSGFEGENYFLVGAETQVEGQRFIDSHNVKNQFMNGSKADFTKEPPLSAEAYTP